MADNFLINEGSEVTIRAVEKTSKKHQVVVLDLGGSGAESLLTGTLPVSAATLPLPSGAATAAKQPALGTAGSASADVITIQGVASMVPVKVDGSDAIQPVSMAQPATGTLANVAGSITSVTLIASNSNRLGFIIFNDSTATLYVKFGSSASLTSFTYKVDPYGTLEMLGARVYTGIVTGIWDAAAGNARNTELS